MIRSFMNSWAIRHRGDQDKPNTLKLLSIIFLDIPKYIKLLFFLGTVTMWVFVQNQEPGQTGGALGAGGRGSSARRSSGTTPPGSIHRRYQGGPREGLQGESPREGSGCRMEWTGWVDWAWVLVRIGSLVMVYTNKTTHFIFFRITGPSCQCTLGLRQDAQTGKTGRMGWTPPATRSSQ